MITETVILIGMSGCGKTSLGHEFARRIGLPFRDTDEYIERTARLTVSEIFARDGEGGFRATEHDALKKLTAKGGVISAGGGIVTFPQNIEILSKFPVIYLRSSVDKILSNLNHNETRPLLVGDSAEKRKKIKRLMEEREELYEQTASVTVNVDCDFDEALKNILSAFTGERSSSV